MLLVQKFCETIEIGREPRPTHSIFIGYANLEPRSTPSVSSHLTTSSFEVAEDWARKPAIDDPVQQCCRGRPLPALASSAAEFRDQLPHAHATLLGPLLERGRSVVIDFDRLGSHLPTIAEKAPLIQKRPPTNTTPPIPAPASRARSLRNSGRP